MGIDFVMIQLCARLFILLALGQAAVIEPGRGPEAGDDICPCIGREECPRIFGSKPEDALLGSFSACRDPGAVRCCGVSTQISVEHSVSGSDPRESLPVPVPPGIEVPIPFQFPEYVDPRTTTEPSGYEGYDDEYENDESNPEDREYNSEELPLQAAVEKSPAVGAVLSETKTLRGESIDGSVSQTSGLLDYRGVNERGDEGGAGITEGKISSSKTVESSSSSSSSMSSSSSDKKTETIVASDLHAAELRSSEDEDEEEEEDLGQELEEIEQTIVSSSLANAQEEDNAEKKSELMMRGSARYTPSLYSVEAEPLQSDLARNSIRGDVRYRDNQSGQRETTVLKNREETSSQQKSESSNFEENKSSSVVSVANQEAGDDLKPRLTTIGNTVYGDRTQVSTQQKSESVSKEAKSVEENSSSNVQKVSLTAGQQLGVGLTGRIGGRRRRPVFGQQRETSSSTSSSQQKSESKKESSNFEQKTFSTIASATQGLLDRESNAQLLESSRSPVPEVRRPLYSGTRFGSKGQTLSSSSQQKSESVKKESSSFEESKSSDVQSVTSGTEALLDHESIPANLGASVSPALEIRRPLYSGARFGSRGQTSSSSSQQKSESAKKESSSFEESKSSNVQSVTSGTEALLDHESIPANLGASVSPALEIRRPLYSGARFGSRGQTSSSSSQQKTESVKKESSNFEENKSSNVQSLTSDSAALSDHDSKSELLETSVNPILERRRPSQRRTRPGSRDRKVYGQQQATSSQIRTETVQKESSSFEESKSSNVQSLASNSAAVLDHGSRDEQVHGQQQETSSQQQTKSVQKESSSFEESKSSNVQSLTSDSAVVLDHGSSSALFEASASPVSEIGTELGSTGGAVHAQQELESSSQKMTESIQKESSSLEENKSSAAQIVATNTAELEHEDASLISSAVHKEQEASSQQNSESMNSESSGFQELSTSSNGASTSAGAQELSREDASLSHLQTSLVNGITSEHHEEATSTQEKSESVTSQSSSVDKTITNVASVDEAQNQSATIGLRTAIRSEGDAALEHRTVTSSQRKNEAVSSASSSSKEEKTSTTSNLMKLITGQTTSKVESMPWHVAYIPILINAGFLRDRPISTGPVGLDPWSGVTHSDIVNPEVAPELLPLSCGNVVFGERFMAGRTVLCNIPKDNEPPFRILGNDGQAFSDGKLNGPVFPDIMPGGANRHSNNYDLRHPVSAVSVSGGVISTNTRNQKMEESVESSSQIQSAAQSHSEQSSKTAGLSENHDVRPVIIGGGVLGLNTNNQKMESRQETNSQMSSSESRSEQSSKSTSAVGVATDYRRRPLRTRVLLKRPVQVIPEERMEKEEAVLPTLAQNVNRGEVRHLTSGRQFRPVAQVNPAEVGSGQTATVSSSTSSSSSRMATSAQESVSIGSKQEITKSEFDVTSNDDYVAERGTEGKKSKFYVLPLAPVLPFAGPSSPEVTVTEPMVKTVEVVEQNPKTRTRVSKKRMKNLSSGNKLPANDLQVVSIRKSEDNGANVERADFIIPEDDFTSPSFAYQRRGRNVELFDPEINAGMISPDDLPMTGRYNVIGPLPSGYKDPAIFTEDELGIELPESNDGDAFQERIVARAADYFKPSPVDPINWP